MIMTRGGVTADLKSFLMSRCERGCLFGAGPGRQNEAVLIDRAAKPVSLAGDRDDALRFERGLLRRGLRDPAVFRPAFPLAEVPFRRPGPQA